MADDVGVSSDSIILRPWIDADAAALEAMNSAAPDLARQLAAPVRSVENARALIREQLVVDAERVSAAIEVGGEPVGNVSLTSIRRTGAQAGTAWVSYFSHAAVRGRGLVGRACAALCTWALTEHGLERLELGYRVNNPASAAVARAAGFVVEGLERGKLVYDGVRYDVEICARLATDPVPDVEGVTLDRALSGGSSN